MFDRFLFLSDYSIAHYGRINVEAGLDFLQQKILPAVFPDGKQPAQVLFRTKNAISSPHYISFFQPALAVSQAHPSQLPIPRDVWRLCRQYT
jgi:hypothetical protein